MSDVRSEWEKNDTSKRFADTDGMPPPNADDDSTFGAGENTPGTDEEVWAMQEAQLFSRQNAETDKRIARQQQQDKMLFDELDAVLERGGSYNSRSELETKSRPLSHQTRRFAKKGVGLLSLGVILIFMGIVMVMTLTADVPDYSRPLKLSPVCAIIIGAEILIGELITRGRCRMNIPCLAISVVFVVGCCILTSNLGGGYKEEVITYNNRSIAGEIYEKSYKELKGLADIVSLNVDVNLNPNGEGKYNGMDALSADDIVEINVEFGGVYNRPYDFAEDCKRIIDAYKKMKINVTGFHFKNESRLRSYTLDVEGKYAQDHDAERLAEAVNYVYVEDFDYIEDLEDYSEPVYDSSSD